MRIPLMKKPWIRVLLSCIGVSVLGFIFLNLVFIIDAAYQNILLLIIRPSIPMDRFMNETPAPYFLHGSFLFLLAGFSFWVFRLHIPRVIKAAYLTVPLATVYVMIGIMTYRYPFVFILPGVAWGTFTLAVLLKKKSHWLYLFAWGLISIIMFMGIIFRVDI